MTSDPLTQTKAALKVFFTAVREWDLSQAQATQLLNISPEMYQQYKKGIINATSDDLCSRLALLTLIYGSLKQVYSAQNILLWLKNPSKKASYWKGMSPLETMLKDVNGMVMVHTYLSQLSGDIEIR